MGAFVDLEVLAAREDLAASREGAGEGLLTRVHANVVDQLVLGLKGTSIAGAGLPEACMGSALGPAHVLHRQMRHDLVHGRKALTADLPRRRLLRVQPETGHLLLDGLSHVAEEGSMVRGVVWHVVVMGVGRKVGVRSMVHGVV